MNLYSVKRVEPGAFGAVCEVYVIAEDEKHAERRARWDYPWEMGKAKLTTSLVSMERERVLFEKADYRAFYERKG